jgi:hypothetical protein
MRLLLKLGTGVIVRFVALLAESFATWLFHEVSEGGEEAGESLTDIWNFCRWFVRTLAGQLCGRSRRQFDEYGEAYEPAFFGAR